MIEKNKRNHITKISLNDIPSEMTNAQKIQTLINQNKEFEEVLNALIKQVKREVSRLNKF